MKKIIDDHCRHQNDIYKFQCLLTKCWHIACKFVDLSRCSGVEIFFRLGDPFSRKDASDGYIRFLAQQSWTEVFGDWSVLQNLEYPREDCCQKYRTHR